MINLYIGEISALSDEAVFKRYFERIDAPRQEKVRLCRMEEDKKRSLLAGYLLQTGIKTMKAQESGWPIEAAPLSLVYTYGENKKPYLASDPVFFNISHSGQYVVCALSKEEIGVDIQEHRMHGEWEGISERFFSSADNELLKRYSETYSAADGELFYQIWAVKEAHMKLTGKGMSQGMNTTSVKFEPTKGNDKAGRIIVSQNGNRDAYFYICNKIRNYSMAVCCYSKITDIKIREIVLI